MSAKNQNNLLTVDFQVIITDPVIIDTSNGKPEDIKELLLYEKLVVSLVEGESVLVWYNYDKNKDQLFQNSI